MKKSIVFIFSLLLSCLGCKQPMQQPVKPTHKVTLVNSHKGDLQTDTLLLDSYCRLSEERRSFYLEARRILASDKTASPQHPKIIESAKKHKIKLISGPMLGDVSENCITIMLRPVIAEKLSIHVINNKGKKQIFAMETAGPGAISRIRLTGLSPDTQHTYMIITSSGRVLGKGAFRTAPQANDKTKIRIAFGSCLHKIGLHNPNLMQLIVERDNHAMLLLGDLAVDDREAKLNMHYADYLLRDSSKAWRMFSANIPVYASWDYHDYLNNDKSGTQKGQIDDKTRNAMRKLWQENWNNPPTTVKDRGIYFNTVIGDVEVIMLDTRSCRNWNKRKQRGAYLGDAQMRWLFKTLKNSKAKFIILTSGTMWSDFMSNAKDSWGTWDIPRRKEIFTFIEENKIKGVLLLSGDRHGARSFKIQTKSGLELHEFEVATLGGVRGPGAFAKDKTAQLFGYGGGLKAFGELTFDMSKEDPEVTFRLINEKSEILEEHIFHHSRLSYNSSQDSD